MPSQTPSQDLRSVIASNVDRAISEKGMTNRSVGEAIGTTEHQVWRWRRGRVQPSNENLAALAAVLADGDIYALLKEAA